MIAFAWSANGNKFNRYPTSSINLLQMNTIKIEMVDLARILRLSDTDVGKFFRTTYLYITKRTAPKFEKGSELLEFVFTDFQSSLDKQIAAAEHRSVQNSQNASGKAKVQRESNPDKLAKTKRKSNGGSNTKGVTEPCSKSQDENANPDELPDLADSPSESSDTSGSSNESLQINEVVAAASVSISFEQLEAIYPKKDSSASCRNEAEDLWEKLSDEEKRCSYNYVCNAISQSTASTLPFLRQYIKSQFWHQNG